MIEGVIIRPLKKIPDERGKVLHMIRCDDPGFTGFGEIYFSFVRPGAIKGWHIHEAMTLNYAVVRGMIKLVLYDDREGSKTRGEVQEIFTGDDDYKLITVPKQVWNGFKGLGDIDAIVANAASAPHDPGEIGRMDPFTKTIPYDWSLKHG